MSASIPDVHEARVDGLFSGWTAQTPGAAVGVVRDGAVVLAKGYGSADLEHGVALGPDSRFYMASVSKQFTAMAALMLARQKGLDLAAPVREWVPELPACARDISLYHLLTHTSGLRDYFTLGALAGRSQETVYTEPLVLGMLARQQRLNFRPGTEMLYSNSGYVLASIIIERVSGQRLDAFARQRIFAPLGMDATLFQHDHSALVVGKAFGYERRGDAWFACNSPLDVVGDGGMYSSVNDMLAWLRNLQAPQVGAGELEQMQKPARLNGGRLFESYGLGLALAEIHGLAAVGHSGGLRGYRTQVLWIPSERFGVVVLCNNTVANPTELALQIAEIYLNLPEDAAVTPAFTVSRDALAAKAGLYRWAHGGYFELAMADGVLVLKQAGGAPLIPLGPGTFRVGETTIQFETEDSGRTVTPGHGPPEGFARCTSVALSHDQGDAYAGRYASAELDVTYIISRTPDGLALQVADMPAQPLTPAQTDEMLFGAFGVRLVFERGRLGSVIGFRIDDLRAKRIRFRRLRSRRSETRPKA